jgi:hypothetical protein
MQADYPANEGVRLRRRTCKAGQADLASGRLFLCAGCRRQVIVCSCCDRGQIYCERDCAQKARRHTLQQAGRRYQASRRGRRMHAARMSRWRAQRDKVTHHGSPAAVVGDLLAPAAMTIKRDAAALTDQPRLSGPHCSWCGGSCLVLLRQGFLRRRRRHRDRPG